MSDKTRQWVYIKTDSDGKQIDINLTPSAAQYSSVVYSPSDVPFAWLGVHMVSTGTINVKIDIQYQFPGTSKFQDAIEIEDVLQGSDDTVVKYYRLDAILGANWIPNVPFRIKFTGMGAGGVSTVIKGVYSV